MAFMAVCGAFTAVQPVGAWVSKVDPIAHADRYLHLTGEGRAEWVDDPQAATAFPSLREATRMAMRLPSGQRAFGVPAH